MRLLELQFGGVFAGDDAFVKIDVTREAVEQCCFARTRSSRYDCIAPHAAQNLQNLRSLRSDRAELHQLIKRELVFLKFADGEARPVERKRGNDDVHARAVGKASIADG